MSRSRSTYLQESNIYTFMKNGQSIDESGNNFTLSNEHSNILASKFKEGYFVVGFRNSVIKNKTYFMLHNPDTGASEIGYIENDKSFSQLSDQPTEGCDSCNGYNSLSEPLENIEQQPHQEYVTLLEDSCNLCLNFGLDRPIMDIELKVENVGEIMVFAHKGNPPRYIELDNIDRYLYEGEDVCGSGAPVTCLDCDKLRIFSLYHNPIVKDYSRVLGGSLKKGTYEVVFSYCDVLGNEKTSYTTLISPPISIFNEADVIFEQNENNTKTNYSIKIDMEDLDSRFTHYKIVVVENSSETSDQGTLSYYEYGVYPTTATTVLISNNQGKNVEPNKVLIPKPSIEEWSGLTSANNYLFGYGIKEVEEVNLQPVFNLMGGLIKWQSSAVKSDLYEAANSNRYKGFNRDEVYPIAIRPISNDGYQFPKFPLVARPATEEDLEAVSTEDKNVASVNATTGACDGEIRNKRYQYFNTATYEGRCANFNSAVVTIVGYDGSGIITINSNGYNITFDTDLDTTIENFISDHGATILSTENMEVIGSDNRLIFSPALDNITYQNVSGSLEGDVDQRGVPTTQQIEDIEVKTEVLPERPVVIITLLGDSGSANINIGANSYPILFVVNLDETAITFVEDQGADILSVEGLTVVADDNRLLFSDIYEGITITNISGDLDGRVSERGIPPVPSGTIEVLPQYIDDYVDLTTYINQFAFTCDVDPSDYEDSPLEDICAYLDLSELEDYNTEPIPESECRDPQMNIISESIEIYDIIGEAATYTPKQKDNYLDIPPPEGCKIFLESSGVGYDGDNHGIDTNFSSSFFLKWSEGIDEMEEHQTYNPSAIQKVRVTYADDCNTAERILNFNIQDRDDFKSIGYVHPYYGELLVGDVVTPAYIKLLPETGGSGDAIITIEGTDYTITFDTDLETTAANFVTDEAANILTNHNLTLTNDGSTLVFDGDIVPTNTPTIVNNTGNLRGEVEIGDNLLVDQRDGILPEIDESNARNMLTDKNASVTKVLDYKKIGNIINSRIIFPLPTIFRKATETKFLNKIHKGAIWFKIESKDRELFFVEITKLTEPNLPSLKRAYKGDFNTPQFKNKYIRYTFFEDCHSTVPLRQEREDLANSEVTLTGTSGTANITINGADYGLEFEGDLSQTATNFVTTHGDAIYEVQGHRVQSQGEVITFIGDLVGFDEPTISNTGGDLNGSVVTTMGGYYAMGGIVELTENVRIPIVKSKLDTTDLFTGDFYMVVDLPVTSATGLGDRFVPGDPDVTIYYSGITVPLGSCFSVVTRDEEFSKITVDYDSIELKKNQNWLVRCTFDVPILNSCKPIPYKYGEFGYWQSTDIYPDNPQLYDSSVLNINNFDLPEEYRYDFSIKFVDSADPDGNFTLMDSTNLVCSPIRHFKFPDNKVSPFMYDKKTNRNAEVIIYPLGMRIEDSLFESMMDIAVNNGLISQERRDRITGYEVYRGDRQLQKSVLSSGMLFDVRTYKNSIGEDISYPNYPYNSLGVDKFNLNNSGNKITMNSSKNHMFTYHSPEQDYYKNQVQPSEVSFQGYLFGSSRTVVAQVEDHPKWVILGDKARRLATTLATVEVISEAIANIASSGEVYRIQVGMANAFNPVGIVLNIANIIAQTVSLVATKIGKYRYEWLKTFQGLGKPDNFAYYTTSVAKYNYLRTLQTDSNLLRGVANSVVLKNGVYSLTENITGNPLLVNNLDREESLLLSFTKDHPLDHSNTSAYQEYTKYDNNDIPSKSSQVLSSEIGCTIEQSEEVYRNVASPYVALKSYLPNQYGTINNISWVSTGYKSNLEYEDCGLVLGGDTFIVPHSIKRKMPFFKATAFGQPSKEPFAYGFLGNIGKPKYFIDYEINSERESKGKFFPEVDYLVKADCYRSSFYVEPPTKFYLYAYGQPLFFTETIINTHYRNARKEPWNNFYPQNQDYVRMTQEKLVPISRPNSFFYNYSYSYQGTSFSNKTLPDYYDKETYLKQSYNSNSVMYSQQDNNENSISEPWLNYKSNDYYTFPKSNGKLMKLKGVENNQVLGVFENKTIVFNAVDLYLSGTTSNNSELGTGGIFAERPRTFAETDLGYIGSQGKSVLSCEYGHYIVDAKRGQIFNIKSGAQSMEEISKYSGGKPNGMDVWFKEHLPFKILRSFKDFDIDNPYNGVGIVMGWDSKFKRVFITKRDYIKIGNVTYDGTNLRDEQDNVVTLKEAIEQKLLKDVSWTISYKPESGGWESYMDFKPNYYVNHTDYFQSGINTTTDYSEFGIWSHLLTNRSKQVFYGKKYPWIVEFPTKNDYTSKKLEGLSIWTEAKRYHNEYDYAIDDRVTFNKLNVSSDRENSGNLVLVPNNGVLSMLSKYPITKQNEQEILITQNNDKWTLNSIYNRAKSNRNNIPLFLYDENQIDKSVNPNAVSFFGKPVLEQLSSDNFLVRLTQDKTSQYDLELKFVVTKEEI